MDPSLPELPIRPLLPEVVDTLGRDGAAVLVAPPGAGKTTLVPLALLGADWLSGTILVLEPRRLATRAAAHRMAQLLGEGDVGGTVGYRIRMETRVGPNTRIEVVTEGILTRMLQSDPALSGVGAVIFDEFHERSLHADVGLALALQTRSLFREDLRLLVMSATLEAEPVAGLLGGAPVLESRGRTFPVETRWRERAVEGWIEPAVAATVQDALHESGDILVFLPGAGEIRRTRERLAEGGLPPDVELHTLHGSLPREAQDRAVAPSPPGRRKVVLSSAIAETSLTIEGVRVVVDAGLMRVPRFDPGTGMTRLETVQVTRDSADQRRGRAGRVAPGVCFRLWTPGEDRGLVPARTPEILDADLAPLALELASWGAEPEELQWLDPPPRAAFAHARELLEALGLIDTEGGLTPAGREVSELGLHPRLGRMLLKARELGLERLGCELAAILGDRDILQGPGRAPDADLRLRVEAVRSGRSPLGGHRLHRGGLVRVRREVEHWRRRIRGGEGRGGGPSSAKGGRTRAGASRRGEASSEMKSGDLGWVGLLTAFAYPDRIGQRREGQRGRFLLRNARGAEFRESQSLEAAEWIVAAAVEARGAEARIFLAAPLTEAEVEEHFDHAVEEAEQVEWDEEAGRVRARRVRRLGALEISTAPLRRPAPHLLGEALLEGVRSRGSHVIPWSKESAHLRDRLQFLHVVDPEGWPDTSEQALMDTLEEWLLPFLSGARSLDALRGVDLQEALLSRIPWEARSRLDELAPSHIQVPSGSRIRVDYENPEAPALAVRLQEVFGLDETPRIAGGRVALTVRLLSPARRPVQVTRDLASFWREGYFEVRKDLRGRYPKHYWPEDPHSATPTRRTRPR
jgi:ATP-dependent helicase HrpB